MIDRGDRARAKPDDALLEQIAPVQLERTPAEVVDGRPPMRDQPAALCEGGTGAIERVLSAQIPVDRSCDPLASGLRQGTIVLEPEPGNRIGRGRDERERGHDRRLDGVCVKPRNSASWAPHGGGAVTAAGGGSTHL